MLRANEARQLAEVNTYKIKLENELLLDSIISRIRSAAKLGLVSLVFDTSANKNYFSCYRPLLDLEYKVIVKKDKFYIKW